MPGTIQVSMPDTALSYASWGISFLLVFFYKWRQFNTPNSNRSSTFQSLYWWSFATYLVAITVLFLGLWITFRSGVLNNFLPARLASSGSLAPPLLVALALTTATSTVEPLKILDDKILAQFHEIARIPNEVAWQSLEMNVDRLQISEEDLTKLTALYRGNPKISSHFRTYRDRYVASSEYRMTAVAKVSYVIQELASNPTYRKYFSQSSADWERLKNDVGDFLFGAARSLELGTRLEHLDPGEARDAYDDLMEDRRRIFLEECNSIYRRLTDFLARALLRCETTESRITLRLAQAGFTGVMSSKIPTFPIHGVTVFSLGLFLYFIATYAHYHAIASGFTLNFALRIFAARVATVSLVVWLSLRFPYFHRTREAPDMKYFSYVTSGVFCAIATFLLCAAWDVLSNVPPFSQLPGSAPDLAKNVGRDLRLDCSVIFISGVTGLALALCCDDWLSSSSMPPRTHRIKEAALCGVSGALASILSLVMHISASGLPKTLAEALPSIALPGAMMVYSGAFVPDIYRAAVLRSRRSEEVPSENRKPESQPAAAANDEPNRAPTNEEYAASGPQVVMLNRRSNEGPAT